MAENWKHLYQQMKKMVEIYQDEIVPGLRKVIEDLESSRVEVVRCKDCRYYMESEHPERTGIKFCYRLRDRDGERIGYNYSDDDFCSYGERKDDD
jgi:hypothetical protein